VRTIQVLPAYFHPELGSLDRGRSRCGWDFSQSSGLALISGFLYLLGVFAPALVALALTAHAQGRAGTLTLLRRTVQFPGSARWYLFAVGYFAIIKLAVAIIYRLAIGTWPAFEIKHPGSSRS
jgi:hypothetical protein